MYDVHALRVVCFAGWTWLVTATSRPWLMDSG